MEELLSSAEKMGHTVHLISTNGTKGMTKWNERKNLKAMNDEMAFRKAGKSYDIDITFTVPQNFPQRFLKTSKVKMAIYDYESSVMPPQWRNFYHMVDFVLPASTYVAKMFERNGCPEDKIHVVHHGIDLTEFNPSVPPVRIPTKKKFKFLCVAAPHYRKQLDRLLEVYCKTFTSADDVCLILKTKIFKPGEAISGYEIDLRPVLARLQKKYGKNMPEVRVIQNRLESMAGLYTACDAFALMTASEGWGVPFLEALACSVPVIAPRHGGQLDFLDDDNSLLCDTGTRGARIQEQYWGGRGGMVGNPSEKHFGQLMREMYDNYDTIKPRLVPSMQATANQFTWELAMEKILELAKSTGRVG